jgi:flagellar M-ring protein FliF
VTVASNLPDGNAKAGASGKSENSETRERVNYEVSETQREVLRTPGAVKKISVAVLLDGQIVTAEDGTTRVEPRGDEELATLRELVASAAGIDEARGDVLTIKSLAFEPDPVAGELLEAGMFTAMGPIDTMSLIQIVVLAFVALVLGLFVLRPVLTSRPRLNAEASPLALPGMAAGNGALTMDGADTAGITQVLTGEIDDGSEFAALETDEATDPVSRLRRLIEERQAESVEILRGWMEQDEERA